MCESYKMFEAYQTNKISQISESKYFYVIICNIRFKNAIDNKIKTHQTLSFVKLMRLCDSRGSVTPA